MVTCSEFHKDLKKAFNQQGIQLMEIMMKHYTIQAKELGENIEHLDGTIRQHNDFTRYKYNYQRCFQSIEKHIEKMRYTKIKKIGQG